uniref:Uncharacterized protein n=1 Tax=Salvator merianae TaxID=96440 RepID=A0A8D0BI50_SALMN
LFHPGNTLLNIVLTVQASPAWGTGASVAVDIICAGGPVVARVAQALIGLCRTASSREARQAGAGKSADTISAGATVQAGICEQREGCLYTHLYKTCMLTQPCFPKLHF